MSREVRELCWEFALVCTIATGLIVLFWLGTS